MYKIGEWDRARKDFYAIFDTDITPFYDGFMTCLFKRLHIDILKLDEWLHKKHGNYEDKHQSMQDVIKEHYGEKGVELIDKLTDL